MFYAPAQFRLLRVGGTKAVTLYFFAVLTFRCFLSTAGSYCIVAG